MRTGITPKRKKTNLFITDHEAKILWKESAYYPRLQCMIGFGLFRGLRIGEIRAINIRDFKNENFNKFTAIVQKSNILDEFPIMNEFSDFLKKYIKQNIHGFVNGYLFPARYPSEIQPYIKKGSVNALFHSFRKKLMKMKKSDGTMIYPSFADKVNYYDEETKRNYYIRYRIGWHSLRRWFITKLDEKGHSVKEIADIMRYRSMDTVYTYLDCYKVWKRENEIIQDTFGDFFNKCIGFEEGQSRLTDFINKREIGVI